MTALVVTIAVLALIFARVPIAFALMIPSIAYLMFGTRIPLSAAVESMVSSVNGFALLAVPMFLLVGGLANQTGLANRIFEVAQAAVGRFRGGLGYVNVFSSVGFSWMSGTAVSDVAVMGSLMVPQMQKRGYSNRFIGGLTGASSLIAPVMPPSVPAIIFGVTSGVSIGALFVAGIVPAILIAALLCLTVWWYARKRPELRQPAPPARELMRATVRAVPIMFAPVIVLGGILGGIFTPTEAAGVTVAYLLVISVVFYRSLTWRALLAAMRNTATTTGSIMILVAGATLYGWVLTVERVPAMLGSLVMSLTDNPIVFMSATIVILLIMGTFMEVAPSILIVTPVLLPIAEQLGIDPVQYGILMIFTLLIGLMTPPVGLVLFVLQSVSTLKMKEIMSGTWAYLALYVLVAVLIMLFPPLTTGLGQLLGN